MQKMQKALLGELKEYGIPESVFLPLDESYVSKRVEYLDLVSPSNNLPVKLDGVAESQDQPLLYIVNESRLAVFPSESDYRKLRHTLFCRGHRAYLAKVQPGKMHVIPVNLENDYQTKGKLPWEEYNGNTTESKTFFSQLSLGQYGGNGEAKESDYVFKHMLEQLDKIADNLTHKVEKNDVFSLIGRALFFRFLRDRNIIKDNECQKIAPHASSLDECFADARNLFATSKWLNETFNGNFLPLSQDGGLDYFKQLDRHVFDELNAIAKGYESSSNGIYQYRLFNIYDFAHIPVGLLSQVYEKFASKHDPTAKATSVHYTPRNIAATLVEEVFDGLQDAHNARVLDPSCGAGVFLVLAFHKLYEERWKKEGKRPKTQAIRNILERQLTGFDISDPALKLAALSLYLTAIELDPNPSPPDKLRFKDLQKTTLHNARKKAAPHDRPIEGSLAPSFGAQFDGQFDIVIGNPPWTPIEKKYNDLAASFQHISKEVIKRKGHESLAIKYSNPDNNPDLPFLWKATEWAKPGGRIAMVLPARILLKQGPVPKDARNTLFQLLQINGIINCSNLSDTPVWPGMKQGFMLLFASNQMPSKNHTLHVITPHHDKPLNDQGKLWIDSKSAMPVEAQLTYGEPWAWKALTVGTSLDVEVMRKIISSSDLTVKKYWENLGLTSSQGYRVAEDQKQEDATPMHGLPNLDNPKLFKSNFEVDTSQLCPFKRETLHTPRLHNKKDDPLEIYRAPLMLLKESISHSRKDGQALLSFEDIAYKQSFYGYSAKNHPNSESLVRYLHLFAHSQIWLFYALMTSSKFGVERRAILKSTFEDCPFIPYENLTNTQKKQVLSLADKLINNEDIFSAIDDLFAEIYSLSSSDIRVINDTLAMEMPFKESRDNACAKVNNSQRAAFEKKLATLLDPFFDVIDKKVTLKTFDESNAYIALYLHDGNSEKNVPLDIPWDKITEQAECYGSTQIYMEVGTGLIIAMRNQNRYWTLTRARLCALDIITDYMGIFEA